MWWWSRGMSSYWLIRLCSEHACIMPCVKVTSRKVRKMRSPCISGVLQCQPVSPWCMEGACRAGTWPISFLLGASFRGWGARPHLCLAHCMSPAPGRLWGLAWKLPLPGSRSWGRKIAQTAWPAFYLWKSRTGT